MRKTNKKQTKNKQKTKNKQTSPRGIVELLLKGELLGDLLSADMVRGD
jgi:hypothetical protein